MKQRVLYLALLGFITFCILLRFADSGGENGRWESTIYLRALLYKLGFWVLPHLSFSASLRGQYVFLSKLLRLTFPKLEGVCF